MASLGNLASRVLVALVAVPILLLVIYETPHQAVWGLVFAATMIALHEYLVMTVVESRDRAAVLVSGAIAAGLLYWVPLRYSPPLIATLAAFALPMLYFLFQFGQLETVQRRVSSSVMGIVYAGFLLSFLALLKRDFGPAGPHLIVLVLATAWLTDTGGYFAGKAIGGAKLYPTVSPNKTWAGAIGGTAVAVAGGIAFKLWLLPAMSWFDVIVLTSTGSALGQLGDLCESLIKRSCGVKDSGSLLPGHGGILDRVDAVLFIAPYVYVYLRVRGV